MADYATLVATLNRCAERARHEALTLGEVLDSIEEAAYAFICIILALPFLQPLTLGPLSVIGGLTFALLGWQLFRGHPTPVLPKRVRATVMGEKTWEVIIKICLKILGWCRPFTRPRYSGWVSGRQGQRIGGLTIAAGGLLMAIPAFGMPFNNLLPALGIFFACVAELEQDGLMIFVAFFWLVVTVLYFVVVIVALWFLGDQALAYFRW
ncbi:MAG: exopolysaccharide biosynthesis protein [Pseudomonadota bacterium]|nr:exopolysaccharide biosynthesis protein [Pseudomonadota bacterium]